jgi:uncharacterized protein YndB with AHSA1/START domain
MTRETVTGGNGDGMSAHVSESYGFNAPAEVVFGVLTDPNRVTRWLPTGMRAESVEAGRVQVTVGSQLHEYAVDVFAGELELQWRSLDASGLHGSARVEDAPAGGSVVHTEVDCPGAIVDDQRLGELLAETMRHLQRDVSDNFTAG